MIHHDNAGTAVILQRKLLQSHSSTSIHFRGQSDLWNSLDIFGSSKLDRCLNSSSAVKGSRSSKRLKAMSTTEAACNCNPTWNTYSDRNANETWRETNCLLASPLPLKYHRWGPSCWILASSRPTTPSLKRGRNHNDLTSKPHVRKG